MSEQGPALKKFETLDEILHLSVKAGASDVHLKAGIIPVIRRHGVLRPLAAGVQALSGVEIEKMALQIMDVELRDQFRKYKEVDLGYGVKDLGRFRVNVFQQRGSIRMVLRVISSQVPSLADLNLPEVVEAIANSERGLVLVTGVTGSGKSTTLAAIIDWINRNKNRHILTIEDPIEYLIRDKKSIISQRELGFDTTSFARALKAGLRQDPDVILIGEMRDAETINIALEAAETGHLVLSTLHTLDATETVNRIVTSYEPFKQLQIRRQLAGVLKACISQRLARKKDKSGFVPAVEILVNTTRIKTLIEDPERTREIPEAIENGRSAKMQSFDQHLLRLVKSDVIEYQEGLKLAANPEDFALKFSGVGGSGKGWTEANEDESAIRAIIQPNSVVLEFDKKELLPEPPAAAKPKKR